MSYSRIIAEGKYVPTQVVDNKALEAFVDTTDEWIRSRTGIMQRHYACDGEHTSDLAKAALMDAAERYQIDLSSLDGFIVATTTPDLVFPPTAAILQGKLGASRGFAFDVNAVCSGFIHGLVLGDSMIRSGYAKRVAVIGAETMSRILDFKDRSTCVLFGDGAGAVILEASETAGILDHSISNDGSMSEILKVDGGISAGNLADMSIKMNGQEVFKHAVNKMSEVSANILAKNGYLIEDLDAFIPHQANQRIMDAIGERLMLDKEKIISTISEYANTSAASIPLTFSKAIELGKVKKGDLVAMTALGAGISWGSVLLRL